MKLRYAITEQELRNTRVQIYRNLHADAWSVRAANGPFKGKVIAYVDEVILEDVSFMVSEAGRQRVLRERKKNVHAFVSGYITSYKKAHFTEDSEITYNPYKNTSFTNKLDGRPITYLPDYLYMSRSKRLFACSPS